MKKHTKLISLFLALTLLLGLSSCVFDKTDDAPIGMKNATAAGEPFRLYIPTSWNLNTSYGISGGYAPVSEQVSVSVIGYPITEDMAAEMEAAGVTESGARLDWFWSNQSRPALEGLSLGGSFSEVEEPSETLLNKINARRYHARGVISKKDVHVVQIIAEREDTFYVFSYTAEDAQYTNWLTTLDSMLSEFFFAEPYYPDFYEKELDADAETPEGMLLASNNDVGYRFFVPNTWKINQYEKIFSAYREDDRSSVSVVPYDPGAEGITVKDYFTLCEDMMITTAGEDGYELLGETEITLGGRNATAYEFTYRVGANTYRYLQVIAVCRSMLYSLTYTALPENYEAHLADVEAMIEHFEFR